MDIQPIKAYGYFCTADVREGLGSSWHASVAFEHESARASGIVPAPSVRRLIEQRFPTRLNAIDGALAFAVRTARLGVVM